MIKINRIKFAQLPLNFWPASENKCSPPDWKFSMHENKIGNNEEPLLGLLVWNNC